MNNKSASVLRDSGCTTAGIRKSLVSDSQYTGEVQRCVSFGGKVEVFPLALIPVRTPFYSGEVLTCVIEDPVADLILGNLPGVSDTPARSVDPIQISSVTTRLQTQKEKEQTKGLHTPLVDDLHVDRNTLSTMQNQDSSLQDLFDKAQEKIVTKIGHATEVYKVEDSVLYRVFDDGESKTKQIVVPKSLRQSVLHTAHDNIMAGHCGVRRTQQRVLLRFHWPQVGKDVREYCRTCDVCQKTIAKGRVHPVPLGKMPVVDVPFKRIAVDLIGPFKPTSKGGYRYVLTVVDVATRFPEAVPLKNIDTISVAEALVSIFARVGCPEEILSDQGTQFVSDLMQEIYRLLSIKSIRTSPYHPQSNGLVERFNGTLKTMLKKVVHANPEQWDRYIPALLFAYRELPSESTGFSPFELLYGRRPRGPIDLLARIWSGDQEEDQSKPLYQYVSDLKSILQESISVATENIQAAARRYKATFDKQTQVRSFQVGDEVLVLLPSDTNKLLMQWKGPYVVKEVHGCDYKIAMGNKQKIFHANMLQKYHRRTQGSAVGSVSTPEMTPSITTEHLNKREDTMGDNNTPVTSGITTNTLTAKLPFQDLDNFQGKDLVECADVGVIVEEDDEIQLHTLPSLQGETMENINVDVNLTETQKEDLRKIFVKFEDTFTDKPGIFTGKVKHEINLTSEEPIRLKQYPLPFSSEEIIAREIQTMFELGVIEYSQSPYSSPVVLVKKKDNTTRFCIDFRALNKVTVFDAEPIPDVEEIFCKLSEGRFFTKIDLAKGYWQIPVRESDREKTAFRTPQGLFQWTRMPFGLVTAPATFARMMRLLHLEKFSAINFFDDVLISSQSWSDHLEHVEGVLKSIAGHGLTIRPTKMSAGFQELDFLGHMISYGNIKPQDDKVTKLIQIPTPKTKKQVRSLLGLASYYRRFVPNFASLTAPLTDLTRSKTKTIEWTPACEEAFTKIKEILTKNPVLKLPNLSQGFILRTDACNKGIGAVLLQEVQGVLHPVMYISRKLLDREQRYSTIERECLAIVWSINRLSRYLWGTEFILQTDHKPLSFINSGRYQNNRLIRWALSLQQYRFQVEPVSGKENLLADALSRVGEDQEIP